MRIGIEGDGLFGWRGPSRNIRNMVATLPLVDRENEYVVFTSNSDRDVPLPDGRISLARVPKRPGIPWMNVSLPREALRRRIDLMFFPQSNFWSWKPVPAVVMVTERSLGGHGEGPLEKTIAAVKTRSLGRVAARVFVNSKFNRGEVSRAYHVSPGRISVVPNAVDPVFFDRSIGPRGDLGSYLLYVGGYERAKNVPCLLRVFAAVASSRPCDRLVMAGGVYHQNDAVDVTSMIRQLSLEGRVTDLGIVRESTDLAALYRGATALVFPSLMEAFGMVGLEAMACGCPVIASTAGAIPEVVGDCGAYFDPRDEGDMAKVIRETLVDSAIRGVMREKGLQRAADFTWARICGEMVRHFKEVAAG
jgi:glycosyltransferase involved in cell wall biosynthesis